MPLDRHGVVPRRRRDADGGRSRARPFLHRPAAARARHARDHAAGRRHHPAGAATACCPTSTSWRGRASPSSPMSGRRRRRACRARSAVVGFSASEVYAIAELIRRQRGGTAIVMGALSPRTRNAQVDMFQSGEVDYLVATDAIGMGLNMDVNHVWFASLRKFDGRTLAAAAQRRDGADRRPRRPPHERRHLRHHGRGRRRSTPEIGRGDREPPLRSAARRAVAQQRPRFPLRAGADRLAQRGRRTHAALQRVREQDDQLALQTLSTQSDFLPRLRTPQRVRLLWEVCQVPDFRKTMTEEHTRAAGPALRAPDAGRRAAARGLDREPHQAAGALRRRHRHADGAHRPCADLDLYFASSRLDPALSPLAGADARHRGQAFRRAAPASDAKVCR